MNLSTALELKPHQLIAVPRFEFQHIKDDCGAVELFADPLPGRTYVIGADFAYGLAGRDLDTACVLDKTCHGREPVPQVCETRMTLGERADRMLYVLARYYNDAFIVGERQVGLPSLRRLWDDYQYRWLYFDRDDVRSGRPKSSSLGHHRRADDVPFRNFRLAVANRELLIRSAACLEQMRRLAWRPKGDEDERHEDRQLAVRLEGGGSPDMVMAAVYAWLGITEIVHFDPPSKGYAPDTYGAIFGHDELEGKAAQGPVTWRR